MEKQNEEGTKEVFGYRMGEFSYCPECYKQIREYLEKVLKDSEGKIPTRVLSADDLNGYFCNQCKTVQEAWAWKLKNQPAQKPSEKPNPQTEGVTGKHQGVNKMFKDLGDPCDMVEHCMRKIAFVREFFSHNVPDDERWSENAMAGFHFIMDDLENDLEVVSRQLLERAASEIAEKWEAK